MKCFVPIVTCLLFLFTIAGCRSQSSDAAFPSEPTNPGVTLQCGNYYLVGDYEEGLTPYVTLSVEDNYFAIGAGSYVSHHASGIFEIKEGRLVATTQTGTYVFEIMDSKTLVMLNTGNDEQFPAPEVAKFVLREETP